MQLEIHMIFLGVEFIVKYESSFKYSNNNLNSYDLTLLYNIKH